MKIASALASSLLLLNACTSPNSKAVNHNTKTDSTSAKDTHTLSNADSIDVQHLHLDISVSFDKKEISGMADWTIHNKTVAKEMHLDSYALSVDSVLVDGQKGSFSFGEKVPFLGQQLRIPIQPDTKDVKIFYASSDTASALQWLSPAQTMTKKKPFLYTQSESIYARSWVPCPDGSGIRFTYDGRSA